MALFLLGAGMLTGAMVADRQVERARRNYALYGRRYSQENLGPIEGVITLKLLDVTGLKPNKHNKEQQFYISGAIWYHAFDPVWARFYYYKLCKLKTGTVPSEVGEPHFMKTCKISVQAIELLPPSKLVLKLSIKRKRKIKDKRIGTFSLDLNSSFDLHSFVSNELRIPFYHRKKEVGKLHLNFDFMPAFRYRQRIRRSPSADFTDYRPRYANHEQPKRSREEGDIPYGQPPPDSAAPYAYRSNASGTQPDRASQTRQIRDITRCNQSTAERLFDAHHNVPDAVRTYFEHSASADRNAEIVTAQSPPPLPPQSDPTLWNRDRTENNTPSQA